MVSAQEASIARADVPGPELQYAIEQFLYHEAELLDEHRIDDWVALMAADVRYFMPIRTTRSLREQKLEYGDDTNIALFDETKGSLEQRLRKLQTGQSWSETPPSRTRHLITNVRVRAGATAGEYLVRSAFFVYRNRLERQTDTFAGERHDTLRRTNGDAPANFEIASRRILVDQSTILSANISIFF